MSDKVIIIDSEDKEETSEFIIKCEELIKEKKIKHKKEIDELRELIKLHKKELKQAQQTKPNKKSTIKTGFVKPSVVPDNIADFLGIERGTMIARTKVGSLLMNEFKKRNLLYAKDKRIIIPNNDIYKLFPKLKVTDKISTDPKDPDGLNLYTFQTHLSDCYNIKKNSKSKKLSLNSS